jgi:hypothetical protein
MNQPLKAALFARFSKDLAQFRPDLDGMYMCPICMEVFSEETIPQEKLTDGHIWPALIREMCEGNLEQYRVLLCQDCNNRSGQQGDAHMQTVELVRKGQDTGKLYQTKFLTIEDWNTGEIITVRGDVEMQEGDNNFTFGTPTKINNPTDIAKLNDPARSEREYTIIVRNEHKYQVHHAPVGWVTAAYLFAFWHLGYRYILQHSLAPIRKYIMQSFLPKNKQTEIAIPDIPGFRTGRVVYEDGKPLKEPVISLMLPFPKQKFVYLDISLLDYTTLLPVEVKLDSLYEAAIQYLEQRGIPITEIDDIVPFWFNCDRFEQPDCRWNSILTFPT